MITRESGNFTPEEKFRMLNGKCDTLKMHVGIVDDVTGYAYEPGSEQEDTPSILYIAFKIEGIIATTSPTVIRTFFAMCEAFGDPTEEKPLKRVAVLEKDNTRGTRKFLDIDFVKSGS